MLEFIKRFFSLFTFINYLLIGCIILIQDPRYTDVVRGTTFFTLVAVISVWTSGKMFKVYDDLYNSSFPPIDSDAKYFLMFCGDLMFHLVPFIFLGLPYNTSSILIAYAIMLIWYLTVQDDIKTLYSKNLNPRYNMIFVTVAAVILFLLSIRT